MSEIRLNASSITLAYCSIIIAFAIINILSPNNMHSGSGIDSNPSSVENGPGQMALWSVWLHIHLQILFSVLCKSDLKISSPESWIFKVILENFLVVYNFSEFEPLSVVFCNSNSCHFRFTIP